MIKKIHTKVHHGFSNHPLYGTWRSMVRRCHDENNPHKKYYYERGIRVCDPWKNEPKNFINWAIANGWEKGLELDRIDNNGNYCPENCRFVTHKINCNNRGKHSRPIYNKRKQNLPVGVRKKDNRFEAYISYNGKQFYLGSFATPEEARNIYLKCVNEFEQNPNFIPECYTVERENPFRWIYPSYGKFVVNIKLNKVLFKLGRFKSREEAVLIRDSFLKEQNQNKNIYENIL